VSGNANEGSGMALSLSAPARKSTCVCKIEVRRCRFGFECWYDVGQLTSSSSLIFIKLL
jgi:hypothetical protein